MAEGTVSTMTKRPIDELIDASIASLEAIREAVHENVAATEAHKAESTDLAANLHRKREEQ